MNPAVDFYFDKAESWSKELEVLRKIVLGCGLTEELKWGTACYTYPKGMKGSSNIVLIHKFKEYCALLFFKGALLADPAGLLIQQSEHVQAARQARFTNAAAINAKRAELKALIYEAIEVEKAGLKVKLKKTTEYPVAEEFQARLKKDAALKKAFQALTPGRQRGYLLHFSAPKQTATRASRVEKCIPRIKSGKGLND